MAVPWHTLLRLGRKASRLHQLAGRFDAMLGDLGFRVSAAHANGHPVRPVTAERVDLLEAKVDALAAALQLEFVPEHVVPLTARKKAQQQAA